MLVSYEKMPDNASVWIHQSDRKFTPQEEINLKKRLREFTENWVAHGDELKAWVDIFYNRFVVFMVDESYTETSGCCIDESMSLLKKIGQELDTDFFNRFNVAYKDGENINVVDNQTFKQFIQEGKITEDTIVFNNLIDTKKEFETQWQVPLKESWHKRVLTQVSPELKKSV